VFPISLDNEPAAEDYYTEAYLDPDGEGGTHAAYGGWLRSRPLERPVSSSADWQLEDMKTDVERAAAAGIDGFNVDVLGLSGDNWDRVQLLLDAADAVEGFEIVLVPNANTRVVEDIDAFADAIAGLADHPSLHRLDDGRLLVSPFFADLLGADYWADWIAAMAERGVDVALMPILLKYSEHIDAFADISYGVSTWGGRSLASVENLGNLGRDAADRGLVWMQPVALQDVRPKSGVFDEADNTETMRAMWATAAEVDADWVNIVTWNDYSEETEVSPAVNTGWSVLDLNSYFLVGFKEGAPPPIVEDRIYVSHRVQPVAAVPTGPQTVLMKLRQGSSPARDEVEVLTFLRDGAVVDVTVGDSTYSYDAPAGVHAELFPLEPGAVSAVARADDGYTSAVSSPFVVTDEPVVQDLQYRVVGSGRDGEVSQGTATGDREASSSDSGAAGSSELADADGSGGVGAPVAIGVVALLAGAVAVAVVWMRRRRPA
jgi:hypothetical protein